MKNKKLHWYDYSSGLWLCFCLCLADVRDDFAKNKFWYENYSGWLDMHVCILFLAGVNIQKKLSNKEVSAIGMIIVAAGRYMCVCVYT